METRSVSGSADMPLEGLTVIDAGTTIAGPMAASFLGDFGAGVIKIELPGRGDPTRQWAPKKDGVSLWWKVSGRNKKTSTGHTDRLPGLQFEIQRTKERAPPFDHRQSRH